MAHRLSASLLLRRRALLLLALPVLLLHLWLGERLRELPQQWGEQAAMPPRMVVSYVRRLEQKAPAPVAKPAPRRPPKRLQPMAEASSLQGLEPAAPSSLPEQPAAADLGVEALPSLAPVEAAEPGPEWPLSTRLSYELTGYYRGPVTGQAQVEWIRQGRRYQVHLDVSVGPAFAPLISRRMSSEGLLTPQGIAPQRYDEDTRVLFAERRRVSVLFQGDSLQLANGLIVEALPGGQDAASQFVQLTWLFLTGREQMRVGHSVELPLVLPRRQYRWRYDILGEQELQTPMGPLPTWHLKPTREAGGGDLSAEVWLAPGLQYLPVRLLIRQDAQNYVDLMLKSAPLQEAPPP